MQHIFDHSSSNRPSADVEKPTQPHWASVWHRDVYDNLACAIGAAPLFGIARRFEADLDTRFQEQTSRDMLRRDAHAVISTAGMLGFVALSNAAKVLEQACDGNVDVAQPLAALLSARHATKPCLAELLRDAA